MSDALRDLGEMIAAAQADAVLRFKVLHGELTIESTKGGLRNLVVHLRDNAACAFTTLIDITAVISIQCPAVTGGEGTQALRQPGPICEIDIAVAIAVTEGVRRHIGNGVNLRRTLTGAKDAVENVERRAKADEIKPGQSSRLSSSRIDGPADVKCVTATRTCSYADLKGIVR